MHTLKDTIEKIIKICWTDEGWTSVNAVTGARSLPTGLPMYCALLLGKRLPQEIIDATSAKYIQAYELITGEKFVPAGDH